MLKINKSVTDNSALFALEGRLDTNTSPELEKELLETLDGITELTVDLKELEYISSAGLRILLAAQKMMNTKGTMKVLNVNSIIMEIFDVTGFSDILTIE